MGFWLLVVVGAADAESFVEDVDLGSWGLSGVPVAVGFSLVTASAWGGSPGATFLLEPVAPSGLPRALASLTVLIAAPLAAWRLTRPLVRLLHRLFPDEPGPFRDDFVGLTHAVRAGRRDDGSGRAEAVVRDGRHDEVFDARGRAA
ncbi:hypothetical protein ACFU53_23725 [Streptomyces sp. NPDC057474]|uniref:hypothetical protein n=1 Tax=Streptomyces sp. NPDC057474 TaxID=3346144 RepID=UPI0036A57BBB